MLKAINKRTFAWFSATFLLLLTLVQVTIADVINTAGGDASLIYRTSGDEDDHQVAPPASGRSGGGGGDANELRVILLDKGGAAEERAESDLLDQRTLIKLHGAFMVLAWMGTTAIGVLIAR